MNVGHHGSYVPSTVWSFRAGRILDGLEISVDRGVEVHGISFVERVDFPARRNGDLSIDEFD